MLDSLKKATTYEEQVFILEKRGCAIADREFCKKKLEEINYYRLAAYFLPFKDCNDKFIPGTTFDRVYHIYEFDRKLKSILLSVSEAIEISIRARLSYLHAHKYGAVGYLDPNNFSPRHKHNLFTENYKREIKNNEKVAFVKHHIEKYNGIFPIWVLVELFSFGMLSHFYGDMLTSDQKSFARKYYNSTPKNIISWLKCCTDLRNICAHYGRLYYRTFPAAPAGICLSDNEKHRLWGTLLAAKNLFTDPDKWNNEFVTALIALIDQYSDDIDLKHIAFPDNWQKQLIK